MSNLPFTLPTCDQPAVVRIEVRSIVAGPLPGSLDAAVHVCTEHAADAVTAIEAADMDARLVPMVSGAARTCGYVHVFPAGGLARLQHPRWCARGPICRVDGIHHSRPAPVTPRDACDAVRVWLEQAHTAPRVSVVLETTVDGEVGYVYMTVGQARILVHQVRRLLDASKGGRR